MPRFKVFQPISTLLSRIQAANQSQKLVIESLSNKAARQQAVRRLSNNAARRLSNKADGQKPFAHFKLHFDGLNYLVIFPYHDYQY